MFVVGEQKTPSRKMRKLRPDLVRLRRDVTVSGWWISYGPSRYLVAHGSGWSAPVGDRLYRELRWPIGTATKRNKPKKLSK